MAQTLLNDELRGLLADGTWKIEPDKIFCGFCYKIGDGSDPKLSPCCKGIRYCSEDCRHKDESGHKVLCKLFAETKNPEEVQLGKPLPDGELGRYRRIIFFHPEKKTPEIIWGDINDENFEKELMKKGHPNNPSTFWVREIKPPCPHNFSNQDVNIHPSMQLVFRENFKHDGSRPNISLAAAVRAGGPGLGWEWRGPVYLCRDNLNVTMADYLHAIRFLCKPESGQLPPILQYHIPGFANVVDFTGGAHGILDKKHFGL